MANKKGNKFINIFVILTLITLFGNFVYGLYNPDSKYVFVKGRVISEADQQRTKEIKENLFINDLSSMGMDDSGVRQKVKVPQYGELSKEMYLEEIWKATQNLVQGDYGSEGFKKETILMNLHMINVKSNSVSSDKNIPVIVSFDRHNTIKRMRVFDYENSDLYLSIDAVNVTGDGYNVIQAKRGWSGADTLSLYSFLVKFLGGAVIFLAVMLYFARRGPITIGS